MSFMGKVVDGRQILRSTAFGLLTLSIPVLLFLAMFQMHRYMTLDKQVTELNNAQYELIDDNRRLVSDISVLTSSERIEAIAIERYGMHLASSDEIVRVEVHAQ